MIDSGSPSQVRPLESFKRSRFGLLTIASFIIQFTTWVDKPVCGLCGLSQPIHLGFHVKFAEDQTGTRLRSFPLPRFEPTFQ
jgi:hypothetical protein